MNLKDQVLSIEQIKELRELGFDVNKHSSLKSNGKQIITKDDFYIGGAPLFPTMTIGDIIEVLPKEISIVNKDIPLKLRTDMKSYLRYSSVNYIISIKQTETFINRLFETLKLCIKEKHIAL